MGEDDNDKRRWVPWSREADQKAKYWGTVLGLVTAIVTSGTGVIRVGKFTLSDHINSVREERLITEAQIAAAIYKREAEFQVVQGALDDRLEKIEQDDVRMYEGVRECRDMIKKVDEKVDYFQRRYWERNSQ